VNDRYGPMLRARWGTAGEDDVARSLPAMATSLAGGEASPRRPLASLARLRGRVALAKVPACTGHSALVTVPDGDQHVV